MCVCGSKLCLDRCQLCGGLVQACPSEFGLPVEVIDVGGFHRDVGFELGILRGKGLRPSDRGPPLGNPFANTAARRIDEKDRDQRDERAGDESAQARHVFRAHRTKRQLLLADFATEVIGQHPDAAAREDDDHQQR